MTIRLAGIRTITLALVLVGLVSAVDLGTKAEPISEESSRNADTLASFSSYRTWTKMNTQPMVWAVDLLAPMQI